MGRRLALYEKKEQRMIIDQGGSVTHYELYTSNILLSTLSR